MAIIGAKSIAEIFEARARPKETPRRVVSFRLLVIGFLLRF